MSFPEPPDRHYLLAAMGWLELGNPVEARAELARINPSLADNLAVLEVQWSILANEKNWPEALRAANRLIEAHSNEAAGWLHQAYALRRVPSGGLQAAWDALFPAANRFPQEPTIPYNLACYACQLGMQEEARNWLARALKIGEPGKIREMALADRDLEPLWDEIRRMRSAQER